jgi:NADH dehydrogenase FAD-containing subunit
MKHVVLVGAGHTHVAAAASAVPRLVAAGAEVTLVAPGPFWYSGLATGMLGGGYATALDTIDVGAVVTRGGGRFHRDTVTAIIPGERTLVLGSGEQLRYDMLSLDVGSIVPGDALPGAVEYGVLAKPIERLAEVRARLEAGFARRDLLRVCVVGGGPTGVELTAAVLALARRCHGALAITLIAAEPRLAAGFPETAREWLAAHLVRRGAVLRLGVEAAAVVPAGLRLANGEAIAADVTLVATGLKPPALLAEAGLPCDRDGAMIVDRSLSCPVHPEIFGAGDCVAFAARALPRVGVYAVRQAPILAHNLLAQLRGEPLRDYEPQAAYLLVLNLGDGTGMAVRGGRWWYGRAAFRLKDWIDRRWLAAQR